MMKMGQILKIFQVNVIEMGVTDFFRTINIYNHKEHIL